MTEPVLPLHPHKERRPNPLPLAAASSGGKAYPWLRGQSKLTFMARYAGFFSGELGAGIQPVEAMDPGHAEDIVRAEHPDARMSVIEAAKLEGVNRMKILAAWLEGLDGDDERGEG